MCKFFRLPSKYACARKFQFSTFWKYDICLILASYRVTRYWLFASFCTMLCVEEKRKRIARVLPSWKMREKRRDVLKMRSLNCEKCYLLLSFFAYPFTGRQCIVMLRIFVCREEWNAGVVILPQNGTINNGRRTESHGDIGVEHEGERERESHVLSMYEKRNG